jgi:putative peptide maturation dehydrogenase
MAWVRRTRHLALSVGGDGGGPTVTTRSLLTGDAATLSLPELEQLLAVSARTWSWRVDAAAETLARQGLLVSDEPEEPFVALRRRDEELTALGWRPEAAAFHLATRWRGARARVPGRDGSPPPSRPRRTPPLTPFHERGGARVALPAGEPDGELYRLLHARRTARSFDAAQPVTVTELATLLRQVWGVHGSARIARGDVALRKTSPSGGGLHPGEVYPLVRRVDGLEAGLYHYRTRDHELERIATLPEDAVRSLVEAATAGQWYFAEADVVFVLTARFGRSFWKYRRHAKAYRTLLLDAGHLSQTFYLVCTELGLGPFVTAALNDDELERALGLDPLLEAPLALCGCGRLPAEQSRLDPSFVALS